MNKTKTAIAVALLATLATTAQAQNCFGTGSFASCDDGYSARVDDDGNIYGNDGVNYRRSGNDYFGSDGSSAIRSGNSTFHNDGSSSISSGNTTFFSDGSTCMTVGNNVICN